jgi:hypothetical protein
MSPRRRLVRRRRRALVVAALLSAAAMACYLIVPRAVHSSEDDQFRRACERMPEFRWVVDRQGGYCVIGRGWP